jgi:hypothetical protein
MNRREFARILAIGGAVRSLRRILAWARGATREAATDARIPDENSGSASAISSSCRKS